ncbi:hypothetical protein A33Q_2395 [Indibacter alkaliphilus LW1]|uniref:Uncharacterized protein n=1 Tax=Indibacter alkaliphilus (strain CCUG 57479 / KCTC 22604 / LW1) TaxID=1189612 RepID=S2DHM0_INDAL|nr:hypothetical protein [Indibacter alkaliphilus]EOZ96625.1 hypothetical protein A33Q_2395 [Indibacter alkaliphilus LW1]
MNRTAFTLIAFLLPFIGICQQAERDSIRVSYLGEKFADAIYLLNKK